MTALSWYPVVLSSSNTRMRGRCVRAEVRDIQEAFATVLARVSANELADGYRMS